MTRRTDSADLASCALVLGFIVDHVADNPLLRAMLTQKPELAQALEAAKAALAGVELERVACTTLVPRSAKPRECGWVGLFPVRNPDGFRCARCRGTKGEALP